MTDHANEIREALRCAGLGDTSLIDVGRESLDALLAGHAAEVETLKRERDYFGSRLGDFSGVAAEDFARRSEAERELVEARAENDALRGIASKVMPCHYCGVDEIAKCPSGFPGCALMDDAMGMEEGVVAALGAVADRDRLAEALRMILRIGAGDLNLAVVHAEARAALAAQEGSDDA